MKKIRELMRLYKFIVFQGPRKSHIASAYAEKFVDDHLKDSNVDFIQFHPKYTYQSIGLFYFFLNL